MSQKGELPAAALSPLGATLFDAVRELREALHDPFAPITVVVPAGPNGVLARRALTAHGPILRVWFETPEGLLREQTPISFYESRKPEPAGWMRVTVGEIVKDADLGRFKDVLARPGFRNPLVAALSRLAADGITPDDLRAVQGDESVLERANLLALLLERLEHARERDGIASPRAHADAAIDAINRGGVGPALAKAAIVVGDRDLPFLLLRFLSAWLGARKVSRVATPRLDTKRAALALAAADAPVREVSTSLLPRELAAVLTPTTDAVARDGSVIIARTPDDVRECVECVREVKRAIAQGVALDRIAIVLPDGNQRAALEDALERANIPPTWLTGFPARELSTAKLLSVMMCVACGDETPLRLYELLFHPALSLRGAIGPDAVKGRGRWRRMLGNVAGARGLDRIIRAIERSADDDTHGQNGDPEGQERERAARESLLLSLKALQETLASLREDQQLAGHVRAWRAFLEKFTRKSEARARLLALLEPVSLTLAGPSLNVHQAREELESILDREIARGALTERSIRVLPPMHLLGGEFDVVCILGLTEKRFPTQAKEDALLSDELLRALSIVVKRELATSKAVEDIERRRFAAALGAARKRVWLSVPGLDFEKERPTLPSTFVLDVLSSLLGRRARFSDIDAHSIRAGSRARTFPLEANDALSTGEHLLVRASKAALPAIAVRSTARGLLTLLRSMHRFSKGEPMNAWTGLVPPELLAAPGLDGSTVTLAIVEKVMSSPADLFFREMLGAYPPKRLRPQSAPLEREALEDLLAELAQDAHAPAGDVVDALVDAVRESLKSAVELGTFSSSELDASAPLARSIAKLLAEEGERYFRTSRGEKMTRAVVEGLPWHVEEIEGRVIDTSLVAVERRFGVKNPAKSLPRLALSTLVMQTAGVPLDAIVAISPTGTVGKQGTDKFADEKAQVLEACTEKIKRGEFPMNGDPKFGLVQDGVKAGEGDDE